MERDLKKYNIKIWDRELVCPICHHKVFYIKAIKIIDVDNYIENEIRYLFECEECGYGMLFGMVAKWEPKQKKNIYFEEISTD